MNYSLGILKPDCLARSLDKQVLSIIEQNGLMLVATKRLRLTEHDVAAVYENCLKEDFWQGLLDSFVVGDSLIFVVQGLNAIQSLNDLVGFCEPGKAGNHTIRGRFGKDIRYNVIHSTANESTFWKEASHFFSKNELSLILQPEMLQSRFSWP